MNSPSENKKGFALLFAVIVSGIVLSIGLSLLAITLKQLDLVSSTKGSEVAFQAAAAGMDCLRFLRNEQPDKFIQDNQTVSINCFGLSNTMNDSQTGNGQKIYQQEFNLTFDWNTGSGDVCIGFEAYILDAVQAVRNWNTGSSKRGNLTCSRGDVCTFAYVQGYNVACNNITGNRTAVQRELNAQF